MELVEAFMTSSIRSARGRQNVAVAHNSQQETVRYGESDFQGIVFRHNTTKKLACQYIYELLFIQDFDPQLLRFGKFGPCILPRNNSGRFLGN